MKTLPQILLIAGIAGALSASALKVGAQGRGNFDPEQFRQRAMERYREALEVKNDDEWKIISSRVEKVMDARRDMGGPGGFGGRAFARRGGDNGGGGGAGGQGGDQGGQGGRGRNPFGGEPSPEAEALQKAIDAKAPNDELKVKLAKYRESRKAKEAKYTAAQDELRKVLSVRQEASAVMVGLLQ